MTRPPIFPARRWVAPWLVLCLGLVVLIAALGYDRWSAWRAVDAQERQRLSEEAVGVAENLGSRLQTTSNALAALRAELTGLQDEPDGLSRLKRRLTLMADST